jgi:1,4-alpha-glucan branching enzyme
MYFIDQCHLNEIVVFDWVPTHLKMDMGYLFFDGTFLYEPTDESELR